MADSQRRAGERLGDKSGRAGHEGVENPNGKLTIRHGILVLRQACASFPALKGRF